MSAKSPSYDERACLECVGGGEYFGQRVAGRLDNPRFDAALREAALRSSQELLLAFPTVIAEDTVPAPSRKGEILRRHVGGHFPRVPGWEEVADFALHWAAEHAKNLGRREPAAVKQGGERLGGPHCGSRVPRGGR